MFNNNLNIPFALLVSILLLLSACENNRCFHGAGKQSYKDVDCSGMIILDIKGLMHVMLVEDTCNYIRFEGGENVLKFIETKQEDITLTISDDNSCFFLRDYSKVKAYVHCSTLHIVNLFEASKLECQGTYTQNLFIAVKGEMAEVDIDLDVSTLRFYNSENSGGNYTFRGSVDMCNIEVYYTAKFNFKELNFQQGDIENSSISDLYINPSERVNIKIHDRGNIYYSGTPEIIVDSISGSGKLLKWDK